MSWQNYTNLLKTQAQCPKTIVDKYNKFLARGSEIMKFILNVHNTPCYQRIYSNSTAIKYFESSTRIESNCVLTREGCPLIK